MKLTKTISFIHVVGYLWMGEMGAYSYDLSTVQVSQCKDATGNITRESITKYLKKNAGDFQNVIDFYADIETGKDNIILEWADVENEFTFNDCMTAHFG